jgi:hypothetical protein
MSERENVSDLFAQLMRADKHTFPLFGPVNATKQNGVYILQDHYNRIAHVGRTTRAKNGMDQRYGDHLNGNSSSFGREYLGGQGNLLREEGYKYSHLVVENARLRALLEHRAIGELCPLHLGVG